MKTFSVSCVPAHSRKTLTGSSFVQLILCDLNDWLSQFHTESAQILCLVMTISNVLGM